MTWQLASALMIFAAPLAIGAYDLVAYLRAGDTGTISHVAYMTASTHPAFMRSVCYLFGGLCAHLFTEGSFQKPPVGVSIAVLIALPLMVVFGSLAWGIEMPASLSALARNYRVADVLLWMGVGTVMFNRFLP